MKINYEFACQDDCLDKMVPSDLRQLVCERDQAYRNIDILKSELEALREQTRWRDVEIEPAESGEWYIVRAYRENANGMMTTIAFCDTDSETGESVWLAHDSMVAFDYDTDVLDVILWQPMPKIEE